MKTGFIIYHSTRLQKALQLGIFGFSFLNRLPYPIRFFKTALRTFGSTSEINVDTVSINDSTSITNNQNNDESTVIDDNNEVNKINLQSTNKNSIDINNTSVTATQYGIYDVENDSTTIDKNQLTESKLPDYPKANFNSNESSMNITEKLKRALSNIAPLLRDIFIEFSHILIKTLFGS
ncbi:unnamed protein product [Rotaria sp. Silwood1]|nr:unnamed protein product [Rotaria sp. Silwood1]